MAAAPTHLSYGLAVKRTWRRRAVVVLGFALITGVLGYVSGLFQLPIFESRTRVVEPKVPEKPTSQVAAPAYVTPTQPAGNDSSASQVPLPLILTGTMPGRNAHEGTAFIGVNKESPQTYAAGALLVNNARIAEIYTDHVVLEKDSKRVKLYLLGSGQQSDVKQFASLLTVGGASPPPTAKVTSHEILTDYIRPSPVYDGQVLKGYQVYPGQRAGAFAQMGLQPDDVIIAINGVPLNEPYSAIEQLKQLTGGYAVTAVVERKDKKTESISLDGSLIAQDQLRLRDSTNASDAPIQPM